MRILLIHPATGHYIKAPSVPLGALSIATYLKNHGHTVRISDRCIKKERITSLIKDFEPDVVGLSIMSAIGIKDAVKISQTVKRSGIPVMWGGHYPTFNYEVALTEGVADYVVLGEGEVTTLELLEKIEVCSPPEEISRVNGLAFLRDSKVEVTAQRDFMDPEDLPVIDYSLVDVPKYFQTWYGCKRMLYLYGSKGCPFSCNFCYNPAYNRSVYRKRKDEDLFEEFDYLVNNHGMDGIYFTDDVFCPNKEDLRKFCDKMKEKNYRKLSWGCQARIGQFDKDDFNLIYESGGRWVFFGVETGSPEIQQKTGKKLRIDRVEEDIRLAGEAGLITVSSLILGFPDETKEQVKETIELAKRIDADLYPCNIYTPHVEQELCQELIRQGRFTPPGTLKEHSKLKPTTDWYEGFSTLPRRDIMVIRSYFHWVSFTQNKKGPSQKPFEFAAKAINDTMINIFRFGLLSFISTTLYSFKTFISVVWNVFFFPRIRKEYGLYFKRK